MLNTVNLAAAALLAALVLAALLLRRPTEDAPLPRREKALLWALIVLLTGLRLWRFGAVPGGMNQDGAMAAVDALALSQHGTDRFGTWLPAHFEAWGYGQMSVLLSWCMVPFIRLFGLSVTTARLPALLWSLAGMAAAYAFLRRSIGERAALAGLLFLAVDPWHFMQSRWALDCNLFPHAFLIGFALLYRGREKPRALYVSMVFFALCMYAYGVSFLMVPLFLVLAVIALRVPFRRVAVCVLLYLGLSWPIYGTMLINALGRETLSLPFVTLPFFPASVRSGDILFFSAQPGAQLLENLRALWNVGFRQGPDLIWNAIDGFGTVYLCSAPLLVYGLFLTARDALREEKAWARLLLCYWLCALLLGLCVNGVNVNRLNILFYAHILLIARGIEGLLAFRRETAAALLVCYGLLAGLFFTQYFTGWAERMEGVFFQDFLAAVSCADGRETETQYYITPDTQYTGSANVSEILTLFARKIDAEYFRSADYAAHYHYRNPDLDALSREEGRVVCVVRSGSPVPDGWSAVDFGSYRVLTKEA